MKRRAIRWTLTLLLSLSVTTMIGCQQQPESVPATLTPMPELSIRNIQICSAVSDDGDYTVQPSATFECGETVFIYFEVPGMTAKGVEGNFEYWAKYKEYKLYDPDGNIIVSATNTGELRKTGLDETVEFLWFRAWYRTTTYNPAGRYTFVVTISDEFSGAIGTASANFTLK